MTETLTTIGGLLMLLGGIAGIVTSVVLVAVNYSKR